MDLDPVSWGSRRQRSAWTSVTHDLPGDSPPSTNKGRKPKTFFNLNFKRRAKTNTALNLSDRGHSSLGHKEPMWTDTERLNLETTRSDQAISTAKDIARALAVVADSLEVLPFLKPVGAVMGKLIEVIMDVRGNATEWTLLGRRARDWLMSFQAHAMVYDVRDDQDMKEMLEHYASRYDQGASEYYSGISGTTFAETAELSGSAGFGKTTISHTLARVLFDAKRPEPTLGPILGASYFFQSDGDARRGGTTVGSRGGLTDTFATIARALAQVFPSYRNHLLRALENTVPDHASDQFHDLLVAPLMNCAAPSPPFTIILDALDECRDWHELLTLLQSQIQLLRFHVRFFITTRPTESITNALENIRCARSLDISSYNEENNDDIEQYFRQHFHQLALSHDKKEPWRSDEHIQKLTARAGGLFIWASTICKYLSNSSNPDADIRRVEEELDLRGTATDDPEAGLHDMYHALLINAYSTLGQDSTRRAFRPVLAMTILSSPSHPLDPASITEVLGYSSVSDVATILGSLRGVIDYGEGSKIYMRHPSFSRYVEYACDDERFKIVPSSDHSMIAVACFQLLHAALRHHRRSHCTVQYWISIASDSRLIPRGEGFDYASSCWIEHLCKSSGARDDDLMSALGRFLEYDVIHWAALREHCGADAAGPLRHLWQYCENQGIHHHRNCKVVSQFVDGIKEDMRKDPNLIYASLLCTVPSTEAHREVRSMFLRSYGWEVSFRARVISTSGRKSSFFKMQDIIFSRTAGARESIPRKVLYMPIMQAGPLQVDDRTHPLEVLLLYPCIYDMAYCLMGSEEFAQYAYSVEGVTEPLAMLQHALLSSGANRELSNLTYSERIAIEAILLAGERFTDIPGRAKTLARPQDMVRRVNERVVMLHPHILPSYGTTRYDEFLPEVPFEEIRLFLKANPAADRLALELNICQIKEVAEALAHLHHTEPSVVYGFMEPRHIFIIDGHVAIREFPLWEPQAWLYDYTGRSLAEVKAVHSAPEIIHQLPNKKQLHMTPECDVYSFAMTAYEIFTGKEPFVLDYSVLWENEKTNWEDAVMEGIRPRRPTPQVAPQLTDALWSLIQDCWKQDPLVRPTMSEVVQRLEDSSIDFYKTTNLPQPDEHKAKPGKWWFRVLADGPLWSCHKCNTGFGKRVWPLASYEGQWHKQPTPRNPIAGAAVSDKLPVSGNYYAKGYLIGTHMAAHGIALKQPHCDE
ncbi:hypothetical protein GLOTRDRAFT_93862 [Gloeophyllum trabeum ATCC 11539]|uniref:Protein kinase domain-containing protein n=1 Tax=Gloeophyllum trabeum (strain ATCC 11539 / FP-39264 / Madison 617) TaxID=670483 RepID=S7Q7H9_GLOTA|nr:uncharacterized protein GLOTRDRAFT_93862 [Gloeophyllum trabeum ATCC 11539]EPQ55413.1 hypothetical protein GLOTRDRAFT_93862 [Gloeophyllum trabeum ATCC 11539]